MNFPSRFDKYEHFYGMAVDELLKYLKKNSWAKHFFDTDKLKALKEDDLTPILYSSRSDFQDFINLTYGIRDNLYEIWNETQRVLIKEGPKSPMYAKLYELTTLITGLCDFVDSYYEKANAITFLVPDKRFTTQPMDFKDITPALKKLSELHIDCVIVNVEGPNDKYYPTYIKIYNTHKPCRAYTSNSDKPIFEGRYIRFDNAPTEKDDFEEKASDLWLVDFVDVTDTYHSHYKQLFLHRSMDDIASGYTKMSKVLVSVPPQDPDDVLIFCRENNSELTDEQIFTDKNVRYLAVKEITGEKTFPALRLPASWILNQTDKYLLSCAFQTLQTFINRQVIYKDHPEFGRTMKTDITVIDEDDLDNEGKPYIRTLGDIVRYEEVNGTVFKTHHASPRRHWVRGYERYQSSTGKTVSVQGYWRGSDNKEVIYKLPKKQKGKAI